MTKTNKRKQKRTKSSIKKADISLWKLVSDNNMNIDLKEIKPIYAFPPQAPTRTSFYSQQIPCINK